MKKKYVIIGSSAAGISALSAIKRADPNSEIVCITKDIDFPYNTCHLASYLANNKTEGELSFFDLSELQDRSVQLLAGKVVVSIDADKKSVQLDDGQIIYYDKLLLTLGSYPVELDHLKKPQSESIFLFHTLNDAKKIKNYIEENKIKKVLIIGAGLTGLECADALSSLNIEVKLIEKQNRILPRFLNKSGSDWLINKISDLIKVDLNQEVSLIEMQNSMIIWAPGTKPATDLAKDAGIFLNNGIIVNQYLQTNKPDIYAAGDCIEFEDFITKKSTLSMTWPEAIIQGITAGYNMVDNIKSYRGILNHFSSKINNLGITICGTISYSDRYFVKSESDAWKAYFLNEEKKLNGFIILGNQEEIGKLKKIMVMREIFYV